MMTDISFFLAATFLAGLLTLATVDSQGQPPGGDRDRGRDGDRSRRCRPAGQA